MFTVAGSRAEERVRAHGVETMSGARFDDFRSMEARKDSTGCVNGAEHVIRAGDWIGWARRFKVACCADCWARWTSENLEAEYQERASEGIWS